MEELCEAGDTWSDLMEKFVLVSCDLTNSHAGLFRHALDLVKKPGYS